MSYRLTYTATVSFVGDGIGPMAVPGSPSFRFSGLVGMQVVPGANAPTSGNFVTALNAAATDLANQINAAAQLAVIQSWATGGPLGNPGVNG